MFSVVSFVGPPAAGSRSARPTAFGGNRLRLGARYIATAVGRGLKEHTCAYSSVAKICSACSWA